MNRPRPRNGQAKYEMRQSMMVVVCVAQHISNI